MMVIRELRRGGLWERGGIEGAVLWGGFCIEKGWMVVETRVEGGVVEVTFRREGWGGY